MPALPARCPARSGQSCPRGDGNAGGRPREHARVPRPEAVNDLGVVPRPRPPSRRARHLAAGLVVAGVLLTAAELALRLAGFEYRAPVPIIYGAGGMHRFHPYWFWEPRPGTPVEGCAGEHINAAGYRGPERPVARRKGTLRIVTLGDSSTFGSRLCEGQNYPALLEQELPGSEVLNFGVVGFTAFQGAKLLAGRALAYRPDVVLAAFGATNEARPALGYDVDAKFAITSRTPPWAAAARDRLATLRLFQLVERGLRRPGPDRTEQEMLAEWGGALTRAARAGDYRPNQSVASFERSLEPIV